VVIGVQPRATGLGIGLCAEVREAVPRAVRLVMNEINMQTGTLEPEGE